MASNQAPKPVVLVISTGSHDLKFWVRHKQKENEVRKVNYISTLSVRKSDNRAVHEWLENHKDAWQWLTHREIHELPSAKEVKPKTPAPEIVMGSDGPGIEPHPADLDKEREEGIDDCISLDCGIDPSMGLHPAKLDKLVRALRDLHDRKLVELRGALVVGTRRDGQASEPVCSHTLIAEWLALQFFDDPSKAAYCSKVSRPPEEPIWSVNAAAKLSAADSDTDFEGTGPDYPLKRVITRHVDDCMRAFRERHGDAMAIVSATGGPDQIRAVVLASAKLRMEGEAREISLPERGDAAVELTKRLETLIGHEAWEYYRPAESLMMRQRVVARIRQGDFSGAWSACAGLSPTHPDHAWKEGLRWVKDYFERGRVDHRGLPREEVHPFANLAKALCALDAGDKATLRQQIDRVLTYAAFRIEAALTATEKTERKWETALMATGSFNDLLLEAAVRHYLGEEKKIPGVSFGGSIDGYEGEGIYHEPASARDKARISIPLVNKSGKIEKIVGDQHNGWRQLLRPENIANRLNRRWRPENGDTKRRPVWLRNRIAHGLLEPGDREGIEEAFTRELQDKKAKVERLPALWNPKLNEGVLVPVGEAFLDTHWVHEVETHFNLGKSSMARRYQALCKELIEVVAAPVPTSSDSDRLPDS